MRIVPQGIPNFTAAVRAAIAGLLSPGARWKSSSLTLRSAIPIFWIGMVIRIRTEEKLLRAEFGPEFEEYARRVPAVIPGIY